MALTRAEKHKSNLQNQQLIIAKRLFARRYSTFVVAEFGRQLHHGYIRNCRDVVLSLIHI